MSTFIEMKKKNQLRYNAWNEHLNNTKERTNYSIRRIDLLIISISGGGIYVIFETLREFKTGNVQIENPNILLVSGLALLFAIMLNLFSQYTGYYSNNYEEKYINLELSKIEGNKIDECEQENIDKKVNFYNKLTDFFNTSSLLLMILGIILLAWFNYFLF